MERRLRPSPLRSSRASRGIPLALPPRHVRELGRVRVRHRPGWLNWKSARSVVPFSRAPLYLRS
jgi:hypothetical protein